MATLTDQEVIDKNSAADANNASNVISSASLQPGPTFQTVTPPPVDTSGLLGTTQGAINYTKSLTDQYNTAATTKDTTENSITNTMNQLLGKTADTQAANASSGLNDATTQLNTLNAQASSLNREASAIPIQTQENNKNTGATDAGVAPQTAGALRVNALKALSIAQQADVATANYTAAKDKAQQIIDLKYQPLEDQLKVQQQQYEFNKDALTAIDAKRSEALRVSLDKQAADLASKKATETNNSALAQGWAKSAFDSQQPKLASQISALDPTSATFKTDLAALQSQINPDNSLDSQYKKMQIAELAQKISDAKKTTDLSGLVSPVAQLSDGTYDTAAQDAILAKMSPQDAALVKAVGNYTMDISKVTSLKSDQRQALAAKVALVYPGFDMTNYATHAAYRKSLASTSPNTVGGAINSANTAIDHLASYVDNVSKLGNGIFSSLNTIDNNVTLNQNTKASLSQAQTDSIALKDQLAKFFKGSGTADVTSIDDWGKKLDVNASPAAQKGTVQGAIDLLQGQLVPLLDQYKQTMGTNPPDGLFLKTDTAQKLSNLKNQGYKIDIPGVYYTDKSAWQKYGGGTQDAWNTAITNLQNAGLPITDENILQASQL